MKLEINGMDHMGNGIGKNLNKIVFVPKTVVLDQCEVTIVKSNKKYDIAKLDYIIEDSPKRVEALCPYYLECGGCNISNLNYLEQLEFKKDKVKNIFNKYLNIDIDPCIVDSDKRYHYRNKITYHVNDDIGLIGTMGELISIDDCLLVSDNINNVYNLIKKEDISKLKSIVIKECDNGIILGIYGDIKIDNFKDVCISIYMNDKCIYEKEKGYLIINNIKYMVSLKSFFQINTSNISKLYDCILEMGKLNSNDRVIDLYCGVGSISLYISKYVKSVLGIEIIEDAINDANENAKINNINNVSFICSDVSKIIDDNLDCDVLIVDPPRIGIDNYSIDIINKSLIQKIIYVSCDPMTLVRDLKKLSNYQVSDIKLIDMFPQTHHVESIVLLSKK